MSKSLKVRLDQILSERGMVVSRTKAQALILAGQVLVDGKVVTKSGSLVDSGKKIELINRQKFVSRGGEKLEGALQDFSVSPRARICLDVGASTGGFTDCLLQNGAERVYAIDVGRHQIMDSIKRDPRVVSMEETHILDVKPDLFPQTPDLCVVDVSFISVKTVLAHLKNILKRPATILALVKPQFEVGPKYLKKGVVRSEEKQMEAVDAVRKFSEESGYRVMGSVPSRLKGPKGNQEYFLHLIWE